MIYEASVSFPGAYVRYQYRVRKRPSHWCKQHVLTVAWSSEVGATEWTNRGLCNVPSVTPHSRHDSSPVIRKRKKAGGQQSRWRAVGRGQGPGARPDPPATMSSLTRKCPHLNLSVISPISRYYCTNVLTCRGANKTP